MESLMDITANNSFQVELNLNDIRNDRKRALVLLAWGMPEIIIIGSGASGAAAKLPGILFKVYIVMFLVLVSLDLILLSVVIMLYYKTQQQPANYVAKFAWRAGLILVILAPILALATKAYVALA